MAAAGRRAFTTLMSSSTSPGGSGLQWFRPCTARTLSVTPHCCAKSHRPSGEEEVHEEPPAPIKFSTSKASHRTWKVDRSLGIRHQRPWWKVLPFSMLCISFLAWCVFRKESEVDGALEKKLFEHLPGLLTTMGVEEEEAQTEASKKDP